MCCFKHKTAYYMRISDWSSNVCSSDLKPLSESCVSALNDWISSSANTFTGIRQSVSAKINLWINPYVDAATSESDFDLRKFRTEPISLYLGVSPDNMERVSDIYNLDRKSTRLNSSH